MNRRGVTTGRFVGKATARRIMGCTTEDDWTALHLRGLVPPPVRRTRAGEVYDRRALLKAREVIYSRMPAAGVSHARH